jgi:hypothetical protein
MEATLPDCWKKVQQCMDNGITKIVLYGPPGTGKTFFGMNYGNLEGGSYRLICTEDMTDANLIGHYKPAGDHFEWNYGAGIKAWEGNGIVGGRLVVDEIDKAGSDVYATLLSILDSDASASWENPETGRIHKPKIGFSAVMTTNIEDMNDLPEALMDRFPVRVRINEPHPDGLLILSPDLRKHAVASCDAGPRRISLRSWMAFDSLRKGIGEDESAKIVFGDRAQGILDALVIDRV